MKKKLKQIADKFVKFIMLFAMIFSSLQEPIMVLAETTDAETPAVGSLRLGTDGPVSETGSVSTKATSSDGKVEVTKTVTADPDNLGKYHVEFEVKGKSTEEKNPVYVVIVFDRSGSMCGRSGSGPCTNQTKWDNAVAGAQSFASSVISSISTAKVALVTFASSASKDRSFSRNELATNLFGTPYGATNLHQGLIYANDYLSTAIPAADQEKAKKFVVVMSDGQPTYYVNGWGNTAGNGDHVDAYVLNNTLPYADTLKTKASIYSIGYSLPTGKVYDNDYTYNGTTYHGLTAQQILSFIASPKTTGTGNNYYDAANESQIVGVFNQIATQIIAAGGNATLTDNLGGSFRVVGTENYGGVKKSDTIASITDSGYKFEFDIEIDPDTTTGWHNTNDGFKLEYTDAAGNAAEVIGTEDPYTYWVQKQYNYTVNYYKDSTSGELLATETRQAPKNTVINQDNVEKNKYLERAGEGYEFKNTSPTSIKIDGSGTQVINVIYGLEEFTYKVNYYYDDALDSSKTIGPVTYGTEVDPKDYYLADTDIRDGYKFDTKSDSAVITIKESGKEINIYYVKDNFEYNIYYFFNGTKNDSLTKTGTPLFGTVVNASDNYLSESELSNNGYEDYFLNPVTPYDKASITVGSDTSKNYINIYYVSTDIEQDIEKTTSTQIVDSLDDVVDYKVVYETTATNVEAGSVVTVTITDNLPFEIDTSKSNLSGGTYNNSNKTITWTFTETVSKFTENYTFNKTINYSVLYKDFADISSGSKKLINEAVGTVTIGDKTIDSESDTAEVPVEIYGTVIATYKTEDGTTLADNVPTTGLAGANYTTSSKTFSGYSLKSLPRNQNGKYVAEETIYVNYVYVKNAYAYTIDYHFNGTLDADLRNSGSALYEAVINASDNYLSNDVLSSHGYGNYFLHPVTPHNPDSITIGTDANSNHIDVYYVSTDIEQEIEKTTSTELVDSLDDVVDYKVVYETTATNVKANSKVTVTITDNLPFEIDTSKSNLNGGTYNNSNKTITWTFTETVNEFKDEYTFNKTINYSVVYKDFADVSSGSKKLINEAVGTVTVGDTTIDSESDTAEVPVEIYGTVIATYKSDDDKVLADNVTKTGLAGSGYETEEKEFYGYSLKETPKNQKGKYVGDETIYVNYVYEKAIGYSEEELTKSADREVLSIESPFNYTLSYNTAIYDYVGEVTITIEDTPEFTIDEEKSVIPNTCDFKDGKIVCEYTKTIESEKDAEISITENMTLYYTDIDDSEVLNTATATVKYGDEIKETDAEATTIVPEGKVISRYITEDGEELCDDVETTGLAGTEYSSSSKVFEGYSLVGVDGETTGNYTNEDITITYTYSLIPEPPKTGYEGSTFNYLYFIFSLAIIYVIKRSI